MRKAAQKTGKSQASVRHPVRLAAGETKGSPYLVGKGLREQKKKRSNTTFSELGDRVRTKKQNSQSFSAQYSLSNTKTEVRPSKLLKQKSQARNFKVDFDSRWEKFLELKNLDSARNKIYCATFWQVWKARFSQKSVEKLENQTREMEASLMHFNATHDPRSKSAHELTSEELIEMARMSLENINSSMRLTEHLKNREGGSASAGDHISAAGSTAEQRVDEMMRRYRDDRKRSAPSMQASMSTEDEGTPSRNAYNCRFCGSHGMMSVSKVIDCHSSDETSSFMFSPSNDQNRKTHTSGLGSKTSKHPRQFSRSQGPANTKPFRERASGNELLNAKSLLRPEFQDELSDLMSGSPDVRTLKKGTPRLQQKSESSDTLEHSEEHFQSSPQNVSSEATFDGDAGHERTEETNLTHSTGNTKSVTFASIPRPSDLSKTQSDTPIHILSDMEKRRKLWSTSVLASELSTDACLNSEATQDASRSRIHSSTSITSNEKEIMQRRYDTYKPVSAEFPYDMFTDVFSPNSARRHEYLSTSPLSSMFPETQN